MCDRSSDGAFISTWPRLISEIIKYACFMVVVRRSIHLGNIPRLRPAHCGRLDNQQAKCLRRAKSEASLMLGVHCCRATNKYNFPATPNAGVTFAIAQRKRGFGISITHMQLIPREKIASPAAFLMRKLREFIAKLNLKMRSRFIIAAVLNEDNFLGTPFPFVSSSTPFATKEAR